MKRLLILSIFLFASLATNASSQVDPPSSFDLRNVDGNNYVSPVKSKDCAS